MTASGRLFRKNAWPTSPPPKPETVWPRSSTAPRTAKHPEPLRRWIGWPSSSGYGYYSIWMFLEAMPILSLKILQFCAVLRIPHVKSSIRKKYLVCLTCLVALVMFFPTKSKFLSIIYLTGYRLCNPKPPYFKELTDESRKLPTLSNHGYGGKRDDFKDFVNRVWREFRWIKTCVSAGYHSQSSIRKTGFRIECEGNGKQEIIGEWKDDKIGLRFKVITTAQHEADLIWAVDHQGKGFGKTPLQR